MNRVVFLLEEGSMKTLLDGLLPRLFPGLQFLCVPHEGKSDLEKSLPRKLKAWKEPGVRFVVLRDNDGGDCLELKARLAEMCRQSGRPDTLIRIVCQELEAWYLGEVEALAKAFDRPQLRRVAGKKRLRNPDALLRPSEELGRLIPEFQKISGARRMAERLSKEGNLSHSFQTLMDGVERIAKEFR